VNRDGKLALVTGASGGLGLELAKLLAAGGYDLVLVARSEEKLRDAARDLAAKYGIDATPIVADLATVNAADALFAQVPRCDVLINNAGFATNERFERIEESRIAEEILLDVLTLTRLTRKYLPAMIERHDGRILNVGSTAGFLPGPYMAVYYACKAYVISFSQAIAEELRGSGVTVSCFAPGTMHTGFSARANSGTTPLWILPASNAATMAKSAYRGLMRGTVLNIPWPPSNWLVDLSARLAPRAMLRFVSRKANERRPSSLIP
jgi:uncharacterized protein